MTANSLLAIGITALIFTSFWILFVLLVRKPVSRFIGARWAYYLWLVPLVGLLAITIPIKQPFQLNNFLLMEIPVFNIVIDGAVGAIDKLSSAGTNESDDAATRAFSMRADHLLYFWLFGTLASLLLLAIRVGQFSKTLRWKTLVPTAVQSAFIKEEIIPLSEKLQFKVRFTPSQHGPAVTGLFYPVLLLPVDFFHRYSSEQRKLILQHEIQHLIRHDLLWLLLARIYRCLFWFNPVAYIAEHYIQLDQELSCDEFVLADQDIVTRRLYGETLLVAGHNFAQSPLAPYLPTFSQIKERTTMLKYHHHRNFSRVLGIVLVSTSIFASVAYGVTNKPQNQQESLRPALITELTNIQQEIEGADYAAALEELNQLESRFQDPPLNNIELAQLANMSGYVYFLMKDYENAIAAYDRVAKLDHGVPQLQSATLRTIAQLYYTLGNYEQSLAYLDRLEALGEPSAENLMLKGQTYFQLQEYDQSLPYIDRAIAAVESSDLIPQETWLVLQKDANSEIGNTEGAAASMAKLNMLYPNAKDHDQMKHN